MSGPEDSKWLDDALSETIGSKKPRTDFEQWKQQHPQAVQMLTSRAGMEASASPAQLTTWRIIMTSTITKLAAAAVIAIAATIGITQLTPSEKTNPEDIATLIEGPQTIKLVDGSQVKLAQDAQIRINNAAGTRGFEHIAGQIDVNVAKGKGEFVVTTPYGNVTALGTEFALDLVDGTADSGEKVELLAVEVTEGKVEVSNTKGKTTLEAMQDTIVVKDAAPYDFNQDEAVPARLKERIQAMLAAFDAGDAAAWAANFNINYLYQLGKGRVVYDPLLFGGSKEDAERLQEMLKDVESPEQLSQLFLSSVNITEPVRIYVRSVKLSADGKHAWADCVRPRARNHMVITGPQWHYFDNDWWQIDD